MNKGESSVGDEQCLMHRFLGTHQLFSVAHAAIR